MTLVNVWKRDWSEHLIRAVFTIEYQEVVLPPVRDLAGSVVRPEQTVEAFVLIAQDLTAEFQQHLADAFENGLVTIEDSQAFAFTVIQTMTTPGTLRALAIPLTTHLRRSCLPDWYIPDPRFCQ
jgi:hypothetical protein